MVSAASTADTMAMDSESLQAVTVKKELPDEVKESKRPKREQQMQKEVVVAGLQQVRTKRPVCWSLHKYFKTVQAESPDAGRAVPADQAEPALIAVQAEPPTVRASWKKPLEEAKTAMDDAVGMVGSNSANQVQTVPDVLVRQWAGGRPKKPAGSKRSKYNTLTGQQRLWMISFIEDQITQPGNSMKRAKAAAAGTAWQTKLLK